MALKKESRGPFESKWNGKGGRDGIPSYTTISDRPGGAAQQEGQEIPRGWTDPIWVHQPKQGKDAEFRYSKTKVRIKNRAGTNVPP